MTITLRASFTKNANYKKVTTEGKPPVAQQRQIGKYYDVSGATMESIAAQIAKIKTYLEKNLTVATVYPTIPTDPTVSEWSEEPWLVSW